MIKRSDRQTPLIQKIEVLRDGIMTYQQMAADIVQHALDAMTSGTEVDKDWLIVTVMGTVQAVRDAYMADIPPEGSREGKATRSGH